MQAVELGVRQGHDHLSRHLAGTVRGRVAAAHLRKPRRGARAVLRVLAVILPMRVVEYGEELRHLHAGPKCRCEQLRVVPYAPPVRQTVQTPRVHAIAPHVGERGCDKRGFWKIVVHEAEAGSGGVTLPQNQSKADH
jgi:hypothetical protein